MVHEDLDNSTSAPHTAILTKFDSRTSNDTNTTDVTVAINRLVDAVEYSVSNCKPLDRAQMFGDQFACFLRGLGDVQFYEATIYASTYMKNFSEKQIADKLENQ